MSKLIDLPGMNIRGVVVAELHDTIPYLTRPTTTLQWGIATICYVEIGIEHLSKFRISSGMRTIGKAPPLPFELEIARIADLELCGLGDLHRHGVPIYGQHLEFRHRRIGGSQCEILQGDILTAVDHN